MCNPDAVDVPAGFAPPEWAGPVDLEAQLAATPDDVLIRGAMIEGLRRRALTMGIDHGLAPFAPFKNYPIRDQLGLLVKAAHSLNDDRPREGLRWIGQLALPSVIETMLGKFMLGVLSRDPRKAFRRAQQAFKTFGTRTTILMKDSSDRSIHLHYIDAYAFPRWYHVGFIEGTLTALGHTPQVFTRVHGPTEVEYFCTWVTDEDAPGTDPDGPQPQLET